MLIVGQEFGMLWRICPPGFETTQEDTPYYSQYETVNEDGQPYYNKEKVKISLHAGPNEWLRFGHSVSHGFSVINGSLFRPDHGVRETRDPDGTTWELLLGSPGTVIRLFRLGDKPKEIYLEYGNPKIDHPGQGEIETVNRKTITV